MNSKSNVNAVKNFQVKWVYIKGNNNSKKYIKGNNNKVKKGSQTFENFILKI